VDLALSRRLERAEATASARFVEARARLQPASGACWIDVGGTYAMFDGAGSPLSQSFGLGLSGPVAGDDLDRIEAFLRKRGAPVCHEVSPLADPGLLALLPDRGYRPVELTSVMFRPLGREIRLAGARPAAISVRRAGPGEADAWARASAEGWGEHPELADFLLEFGRISAASEGAQPYLAESAGRMIATGMLIVGGGVAFLAGASTIPDARRKGGQLALLEARLRAAAAQGCDLALMGAAPGSASQRNAERHGFRIAYTRIKWRLAGG
jgi:hypothetical protein